MAKTFPVAASPTPELLTSRLGQLSSELVYAWDRSDSALLTQWSLGAAQTFGTALKRRATNLMGLVAAAGKGSWKEAGDAVAAYRDDRLQAHVGSRGKAAYDTGVDFVEGVKVTGMQTVTLLRTQPREALPQLVTLVATSLLVSGGPDGDGGAPDLDLMFGIGAHRSLFSHSVLMGATLETAFLSLVKLVQLVHAKLPEPHDSMWDTFCSQADSIGRAASTGASLGMSYHLLVDGLLQPAAYHGLGVPLPMEAHQAIIVTNGVAEGIDARHKPTPKGNTGAGARKPLSDRDSTAKAPSDSSSFRSPPSAADLAEHRRCLAQPFHVDPVVVDVLTADELLTLRKYGCWFEALSSGKLRPISDAQHRFVEVAKGRLPAESEHEQIWMCVQSLARFAAK